MRRHLRDRLDNEAYRARIGKKKNNARTKGLKKEKEKRAREKERKGAFRDHRELD